MQLLQEYQHGYYPNHSQEKVEATRSGNTINIAVTAGGKTGKFKATISSPSGASASKKAPVVINIGGMQNQPYLSAGIAIAQFDYTSVAPDSNSKTGAFWDIYKGREIGKLESQQSICLPDGRETDASRRPDGLGLGFPPDTQCAEHNCPRNRRQPGRRDGMFPLGQGCSCSRPL